MNKKLIYTIRICLVGRWQLGEDLAQKIYMCFFLRIGGISDIKKNSMNNRTKNDLVFFK